MVMKEADTMHIFIAIVVIVVIARCDHVDNTKDSHQAYHRFLSLSQRRPENFFLHRAKTLRGLLHQ